VARAPYKLPSVFVGCPYGGKFPFETFKASLNAIPFRWYYADTHLSTKHLLGILTSYIKAVDFCIFDISLWNPNVALEIGLAEGLGVEYYILLSKNLSKGVPADVQGLQRIEYEKPEGYAEVVNDCETPPRRIYCRASTAAHRAGGVGRRDWGDIEIAARLLRVDPEPIVGLTGRPHRHRDAPGRPRPA
jgi:hypothetical protein